ncbi:hypothetical protein JR316_0006135 [Psilocybe cubensis]|uniref:Uncharacterized protein n=2 Tax=Psilocybe cubensis TaxID=181762 RepID=A0ACB8H0S9_PSICU|nr:hypothetical protein JR316_0006135 [Psilocybe cubensis]KAH9481608.1 hypothetical protein JR316_0006135 [Psilocybe cubensis]
MRSFLLIPSLLSVLAALTANASVVPGAPAVRRFASNNTPSQTKKLTAAQEYARELTHRQPTRRSTAQRRQASAQSINVDTSIQVGARNRDTGSTLGGVTITSSGLGIATSADTEVSLGTVRTSKTGSETERRITIDGLPGYSNLGVVQFSSTSGLTLGAGLSNGLRITGIANPGTGSGETPTYGTSYGNTGPALAGETDVWSFDYTTGTISLQWVNPDGSTPATYIITNGVDLAATGDIDAFNAVFGPGWFATTLTFTANA